MWLAVFLLEQQWRKLVIAPQEQSFALQFFLPFYFVVGVLRLPPYFNDYVNDWQSFAAVLDEAIVRSSSRFLVSFQQKQTS